MGGYGDQGCGEELLVGDDLALEPLHLKGNDSFSPLSLSSLLSPHPSVGNDLASEPLHRRRERGGKVTEIERGGRGGQQTN